MARGAIIVVPTSKTAQADALITFYKPVFYIEGKLTGHIFTVVPWGLVGF